VLDLRSQRERYVLGSASRSKSRRRWREQRTDLIIEAKEMDQHLSPRLDPAGNQPAAPASVAKRKLLEGARRNQCKMHELAATALRRQLRLDR
jgi:hypothetical protein